MKLHHLNIYSLVSITTGLLLATPLWAANGSLEAERARFGVHAGMTFSNVSAPRDITPSNRAGVAAGLLAEFPLTSNLALQPEVTFVQRGAVLASSGGFTVRTRYESLEIPVFAKLKLAEGITPYVMAGPLAIVNLSSRVEAETPSGTGTVNFNPNTLEGGFAVGVGADLGPVTVSGRYVYGVTNLDENSADWKSRGIHILVGAKL